MEGDDLDFSIKVKTMEDNQNGKFELDESSDNEEDKQNSKNSNCLKIFKLLIKRNKN
jgi:hypothetical protein